MTLDFPILKALGKSPVRSSTSFVALRKARSQHLTNSTSLDLNLYSRPINHKILFKWPLNDQINCIFLLSIVLNYLTVNKRVKLTSISANLEFGMAISKGIEL